VVEGRSVAQKTLASGGLERKKWHDDYDEICNSVERVNRSSGDKYLQQRRSESEFTSGVGNSPGRSLDYQSQRFAHPLILLRDLAPVVGCCLRPLISHFSVLQICTCALPLSVSLLSRLLQLSIALFLGASYDVKSPIQEQPRRFGFSTHVT
jgi:hypothetical protein